MKTKSFSSAARKMGSPRLFDHLESLFYLQLSNKSKITSVWRVYPVVLRNNILLVESVEEQMIFSNKTIILPGRPFHVSSCADV
jgi:hypothetical protein